MTRWRIGCNSCPASAWVGPIADAAGERRADYDAWCEACQQGLVIAAASGDCSTCGAPLTTGAPRFAEIYGALQNLAAVLAAWDGDGDLLGELLPDRPRFLTDLDPPKLSAEDDAETRTALSLLASGAYADALDQLERLAPSRDDQRLWRALAIAAERRGDLERAGDALTRALAGGESAQVRLERGALRAKRGEFAAAAEDLALAGERFEARWNRAALSLIEAVAVSRGLPDPIVIAAARRDAQGSSGDWSDPTAGRLLWSLLIERISGEGASVDGPEAEAGHDQPPADDAGARALRAAETEFEFDTFWDRAMILEGYARLGLAAEAARVASPLALELASQIAMEPALRGDAAAGLLAVLEAAILAIGQNRPGQACDAVVSLIQREDLRHYRVPCRLCAHGSIGVDEVLETTDETAAEVS
jgi:tetratricopeptide (TPR) repeat protein